jgi:hypothetical protein
MASKQTLTALGGALHGLSRALDGLEVRWALVGGLAVSARAEPRFTRDVDVAVEVASDADAERLLWELAQRGYSVHTVLEHKKLRRLATARLASRERGRPGVVMDLLFCSSGIERAIVAAATELEVLPGIAVPVARVGHLVAMKLLAQNDRTRPQDHDDLRALMRVASSAELARALVAVTAIEALGAHRGKKLRGALERIQKEIPPERRAPRAPQSRRKPRG